jgi:hypothetical protein
MFLDGLVRWNQWGFPLGSSPELAVRLTLVNTEHSGPRTKTIWAIQRKKLNQLESTYIYIYIIGQEKYNSVEIRL